MTHHVSFVAMVSPIMTRAVTQFDVDASFYEYSRNEAREIAEAINDSNLPAMDNAWDAMAGEIDALAGEAMIDASYRWA
jgi:ABC-type cobalt transport system substrate-binding protein